MSDMDLDNLDLLIDGFLNGELAESQREELAARLERDPRAARVFDDALRTEALLHAAHGSTHGSSGTGSSAARNAVENPRGISVATRPIQRADFTPVRAWVAVAALVAVMFGGALYYKHLPSASDKKTEAGGGKNTNKNGASYVVASGRVWVDGRETKQVRENEWLNVSPDGPAVFKQGDALKFELESESGALLRKNGATLLNGAGNFNVQPAASAFVLETAAGNVMTKSGEFSARLESEAAPENTGGTTMKSRVLATLAVTVLAGSVQVESGGKVTPLALGESRVFGAEGEVPRGPRRGPDSGVTGMMLAHVKELGLSDDQIRQLKEIKAALGAQKAVFDADQKLRDLHGSFGAALQTREEAAVKAARIAVQNREEELRQGLTPPGNPLEVLTESQRGLLREILEISRPPHRPDDGNGPPPPDAGGPDGQYPPPPRDGPPRDGPPRDGPPPPRGRDGAPPPPDGRQPSKGGDAYAPPPARLDDAALRMLLEHAEELKLTDEQKSKLKELVEPAQPK